MTTPGPLLTDRRGDCRTFQHFGAPHDGCTACHHPKCTRIHSLPNSSCSAWELLPGAWEAVRAIGITRYRTKTPWQQLPQR